jgi:hypothetical protein
MTSCPNDVWHILDNKIIDTLKEIASVYIIKNEYCCWRITPTRRKRKIYMYAMPRHPCGGQINTIFLRRFGYKCDSCDPNVCCLNLEFNQGRNPPQVGGWDAVVVTR